MKSTKSELDAAERFRYITTIKYGTPTSPWKGTATAFINHWINQVRMYDDMVESSDRLGKLPKTRFLQEAVRNVDDL